MVQALVIVLREGFEAFLIVSIIVAYLQKVGRHQLLPPVYWGIGASLVLSGGLGWGLAQRGFDPLWEGILGLVAVVFVSTLVIQMWRHARHLKRDTETKLAEVSTRPSPWWAAWGVFVFTVLMVAREGIETALMLVQVRDPAFLAGVGLGLLVTVALAVLWVRCSHLINLKLFFQVTSLFLLLFLAQILLASFHEFSEAGVLPNSEAFHAATEPLAPDGRYGKWFSIATVVVCFGWLLWAWGRERLRVRRGAVRSGGGSPPAGGHPVEGLTRREAAGCGRPEK